MTDMCEPCTGGFHKAEKTTAFLDKSLGISGAWFVGSSRDYFTPYNENGLIGYEVTNCCGVFILAIKN